MYVWCVCVCGIEKRENRGFSTNLDEEGDKSQVYPYNVRSRSANSSLRILPCSGT
jgi:hypothetical protein